MFTFSAKKERFVGLDIGNCSIKLAELASRQGKLALLKLDLQNIDFNGDNCERQLDAIKSVLRNINTKEAKINVVINCSQSCTKICVIPFMPRSEITEALKWQIRDSISFPIDRAILDYKVLQEIVESGVKKLRVAIACCPRETVDKYIDLLHRAGAQPSLFTQHSFALRNVLESLCPDENKTVALLDIGCNLSELLIFQNGELALSRKLPIAGQDFTEGMTQLLVSEHGKTELAFEEAESIKKKYGLHSPDDSQILDDKVTSLQLVSLLRPTLEKLTREIERSFAYYHEKEASALVESLILLGGGSNLHNLTQDLSESLSIPVRLAESLAAFPSDGQSVLNGKPETTHYCVSALGAALACPDDINLLPVEIKQQTKLLIKRSSIEALATAVIVIMVLVFAWMRIKLGNYDKGIATTELQLRALSPQIEILPRQAFLCGILNKRIYWSDALKEISNLIPELACLTEMNANENTLILKGTIKSPSSVREQVLIDFMRSLENGIFSEVELISTKDSPEDKYNTFELRLRIE